MKKLLKIGTLIVSLSLSLTGCTMAPVTVVNTSHGRIIKENITKKKDSSIIATLGGAALGGLLGSQIGGGSGKTAATVAGVIGGGYAGKSTTTKMINQYSYVFKMDSGDHRLWKARGKRYHVGQKVVIEQLSSGYERVSVIR